MDTIDLKDPNVRARVEYLGDQAERAIYSDFVARHSELLNVSLGDDCRNKVTIDGLMQEKGLPLTPENLELCYSEALQGGLLSLGMYHPLELEAFPRMTTEQLKIYLERQYQAPRPANMAEYLPTSGERMWNEPAPQMS